MKLRVVHRTSYRYTDPATASHHEARLTPRQSEGQRTITHELAIDPLPSTERPRFDYFGNRATYFGITEPHRSLDVTATSLIETFPVELPEFDRTPAWEHLVRLLGEELRRDVLTASQMRFASPLVPLLPSLRSYAEACFPRDCPVLVGVAELMRRIHSEYIYDPAATDCSTPVATVAENRRGVCQDFAHVMLSCLRSLGLAARYTSGYLRTRPPPGIPRLVGADASHAWISVWIPEYGWIDFDPTNNQCPREEYVTVAFGRDYADVTPIRGVILGGGTHRLEVSVDVEAMS
jgi:transglutaminase-like putative cysteine protease